MVSRVALFLDRREAGRTLAGALGSDLDPAAVVAALPRGGVPVGYEVARAFGVPLDVICVRKLGAPFQPEYGIGAIGEDGVRYLRSDQIDALGIGDEELEALIVREAAELDRRTRLYRGGREPFPVAGRTVILVDDGVATGGTAIAGGQVLRGRGAGRVVLAVPVGPPGTRERLASEFDDVVCVAEPEWFLGVGSVYADFRQTSDAEVVELLRAAHEPDAAVGAGDPPVTQREIEIEVASGIRLPGDLRIPEPASGLVLFAHGSGSSRLSPRNREVATALNGVGLATLLFDLVTEPEAGDRDLVFDIGLLAERLVGATRWARRDPDLDQLPLGYFGASTGAAAALRTAADVGAGVGAVVSRGGRPDLARERLGEVVSPTLLIVGGHDWGVLELNRQAAALLRCKHELAVVPTADHLFEQPGALQQVAALAAGWFSQHLAAEGRGAA